MIIRLFYAIVSIFPSGKPINVGTKSPEQAQQDMNNAVKILVCAREGKGEDLATVHGGIIYSDSVVLESPLSWKKPIFFLFLFCPAEFKEGE